jgi:type I restriction enzyme, R subunit
MAKKRKITADNETVFEKHFCHQLEVHGKYRLVKDSEININKDLCLYLNDLEEFLQNTQQKKLLKLKEQFGVDWKIQFQERIKQELSGKQLFEILQDGIEVIDLHFDLIFFKPSREGNTDQQALYEKNRFTAVRQWHFGADTQRESFDIALLVNGFAIVTIELKNQGTSGDYTEAVKQYLGRDLSLPIFKQPFLHIVCDNETVKMAAAFSKPPDKSDFRDFNMDLVNIAPNKREYPVHYLYHDILLPERLLNYIESYLYPGKAGKWIFPRFHQQRATRKVIDDIKENVEKSGELDLRYLIQHSTGSGKSNTIVWMVQNLRNAYVGENKIFDSIVVLTDRINLDDQISRDFQKAILTDGVAEYAESTSDLKKALQENKKVIVSTIHKFTYLKDLSDQTKKRICLLIDEAHRSQEGKLHEGVTGTFESDEEGVEKEPTDKQEVLISEIERKKFPNMAFIALTATPSPETLKHFGIKTKDKKGKTEYIPHDVYSMDQAIAEGYIMDVAKHIYSYDTLYELNKEADTKKEYLPIAIRRALRQKAYEDSGIIKEKCDRIVRVFRNECEFKIKNKAKAMVVSSSRVAAVKYKIFLDAEIKKKGLDYKCLVAFSGSIDLDKLQFTDDEIKQYELEELKGKSFTEDGMNKTHNPKNEKTEDIFEKDDKIRFLIVANKFQTGFSEALLHTMFVDKPLRGRNAVQTLSRLNRIHPDKKDTLVVDFSGSYEQIMKAYEKYQKDVTTHKDIDPKALFELKEELLKFAIFTLSDVKEIADLGRTGDAKNMPAIAGLIHAIKEKYTNNLSKEKQDEFRILLNRYLSIFNYLQIIYKIPRGELWDFQIFTIYLNNKLTNTDFNSLMKDIEDVAVVNYSITDVEQKVEEDGGTTGGSSSGNSSVTKVKITKTIKEVIEEINMKFRAVVGTKGVEIIGDFLEIVSKDEGLRNVIINNAGKNPDLVFEEILKDQFVGKLTELVMLKDPALYEKITSDEVLPYINRAAYNLLRNNVLAA